MRLANRIPSSEFDGGIRISVSTTSGRSRSTAAASSSRSPTEATITPRRAPADSPLASVIPLWTLTATQSRRPPRLRTGALPRERLVRRLVQAVDVPMILLVAPAGYGKSTLLAQWLAADPRPCRWISFEDTDDEPRRVLALIAHALDDLSGEGGRPSAVTAPTLGAVKRSLEAIERPFVLVLDDLHGVRSQEALAVLPAIAELLPEGAQLALASRDEPAIPIGRLRAHGRLMDLRTRDLAMSRGEATGMLRLAGLELPADDVLT